METDGGGIGAGCGIGIAVVIVLIAQLASGLARPSSDAGVSPEAIPKRATHREKSARRSTSRSYKI